MQDNEPVRRQGPRRKASSKGIPEEQERAPRNEEATAPAVDADAARCDASRKKTDGVGGVASTGPKPSNFKIVLGAFIVLPLAVALAVAIVMGLSRGGSNDVVEAEDATINTSSTPTVEPIDYDSAETSASLYYEFVPMEHEEDWEDIYNTCIRLVLDETQADEGTFHSGVAFDEPGEAGNRAIEAVFDDPEDFLENHGYATTASITIATKSSTHTPSPTYQEPESTCKEPPNLDGDVDTGVGGGGRQPVQRIAGPFGGL